MSETWVVVLVVLAASLRSALGAAGYLAPRWLQQHLGAPPATNVQAPYIIRVWAVRDVVLGVGLLVALGQDEPVLVGALVLVAAIDAVDVLSAWLSWRSELFSGRDAVLLASTAVAALVPELIALVVLTA